MMKYDASPTISAFIADEKPYTFAVGPIGPVSGDTEFLTPHGWKRVDAYTPGDLVAQWTPAPDHDPAGGTVDMVHPLGYIIGPAATMLHFRNRRSMSMVLSENHRVPYYDYKGDFRVVPAGAVRDKPSVRRIPTAFTVQMPGTGLTDAVLRLAVAIHADGHFPRPASSKSPRPGACIITVRKERKKQRLRALLAACDVPYSERPGGENRPAEVRFVFDSPYIGKSYDTPQWWGASADELSAIMDEAKHWDGLYEGLDTRFSTSLPKDADFIQYAAHATGGRATISRTDYPDKTRWKPTYTVHIAPRGSRKASVVIKDTDQYKCVEVPAPGGKQYCFRTPSSFFLARHNGRVFVTGNSGKSVGGIMKIFYRAFKQAPSPVDGIRYSRFLVVRNTNKELQDTTLKTFFDWFPPGIAGEWHATSKTFIYKRDGVHCEIMFRALDRPDDASSVLSLELTGAMIDEFVEIPREILDAVHSRCDRYPSASKGGCTWAGVWGASNPGTQDSWWYDFLYEEWPDEVGGAAAQDESMSLYEQPSGFSPQADNLKNLKPYKAGCNDYYINKAKGKTLEWVKQFIEVQWGYSQKGKAVYKMFNRELHVAKQPLKYNPHLPLILGFDAGLTPAMTFMQQDPFGRLLILDELVSDNMGAQRFCREKVKPLLNRKYQNAVIMVAADPATKQRAQTDERTVASVLEKELGVKVKGASSNDLAARLGAVDSFLTLLTEAGPALLIDPSCKQTIAGFSSGYKYAINTKGVASDKPDKNSYSHLADAIQYGAMAFVDGAAREARARKHAHFNVQSRNTYVLGH